MRNVPEVTDADIAFGAARKVLPPYHDLPAEFRSMRHPACDAISDIFFNGGKLADRGFKLKEGLDSAKVHRAIQACLTDWAPKHEHKIGGLGFLINEWFERPAVDEREE